MTQLDKLEMLNSQWKSFANCKRDDAKEYAKIIIMYLMSRAQTPIEKIISSTFHIRVPIQKYDRKIKSFSRKLD